MKITIQAMEFKKFDVSQIKTGSSIGVIGKKRIGKTSLIRDFLDHHALSPYGVVFSEDLQLETDEKEVAYHRTDANFSNDLQAFHERQINLIQEETEDPRAFLVIDDFYLDKDDYYLTSIYHNQRQLYITTVTSMQYPVKSSPMFDYVFIFCNSNSEERLYNMHADMFSSLEEFSTTLKEFIRKGYECLVIDNTSTSGSDRLEDIVFWYNR
jgi:hypothetical protein